MKILFPLKFVKFCIQVSMNQNTTLQKSETKCCKCLSLMLHFFSSCFISHWLAKKAAVHVVFPRQHDGVVEAFCEGAGWAGEGRLERRRLCSLC